MLFLSQTLPYPPDGGVKVRTYHILRELAQAFDITALCFARRGTSPIEAGQQGLAAFARVEAFRIPQEYSRLRWLRDHASSLAARKVYTHYVYDSAAYFGRLRELLKEPWALVHADSLDLAGYFPLLSALPLACTHHDIQSVLLTRRAAFTSRGINRWYLRHQAALMRAEEDRWACTVATNVVVSEVDAAELRRRHPTAKVTVVPNGVDTTYFTPQNSPGTTITFVGGSDWFPNRDGMLWFCREVLPLIRRALPEVRICWVGRVSGEVRAEANAVRVETPGHVEDIRPWLAGAACVIAPLRVGGGTRIKILDAWAMGKPVVATTLGAEGLDATDGVDLVLRDDSAGFAEAVVSLLVDPQQATKLGAAGRLHAQRDYTWPGIGARIRTLYLACIPGSAVESTAVSDHR